MAPFRARFAPSIGAVAAAFALPLLAACGGGSPAAPAPRDQVILPDPGFANFRSEQGLTLDVDDLGIAAFPASYRYASDDKVNVTHGSTIDKVVTRLGWTGSMSPADLEGANAANIPAVRVVVPYGPGFEIASVFASVAVSCEGCSFEAQTVDLSSWESSLESPTNRMFLVPLASNTLPALGQLPAGTTKVELEITAEARLAVGSTARSDPWSVTLDLLAPPLAVSEDAGYAARREANSAYFYRATEQDYLQLFAIAPFSGDTGVRVFHFVVSNPGPADVVLDAALPAGSWSLTEQWNGYESGEYSNRFGSGCSLAREPCSHSQHALLSQGAAVWVCGTPTLYPTSTPPAAANRPFSLSGDPILKAYVGGVPADTSGRIIVPRAGVDAPGRLDLYVDRPIVTETSRTGMPALSWNPAPAAGASAAFTQPFGITIEYDYAAIYQCAQSTSTTAYYWFGTQWGRRLEAASERINGALTLRAATASSVGAPIPVANIDLSGRTISH